MTRARIRQSHLGSKQSVFKWFRYRTQRTWDRHRWVVGKAEYSGKGANPRFVVTNLPSDDGIIDAIYVETRVDGKRVHQLRTPGTACSVARNPEEFYRTMKIAARVRVTCRRVVFHLASHCPSLALYKRVMLRLCRSG